MTEENKLNGTYINQFTEMKDVVNYILALNSLMNRHYSQPTVREFFDFAYQAMIISKTGGVCKSEEPFYTEMFIENDRAKPNYDVALKFVEYMFEQVDEEAKVNVAGFAQTLTSLRDQNK